MTSLTMKDPFRTQPNEYVPPGYYFFDGVDLSRFTPSLLAAACNWKS